MWLLNEAAIAAAAEWQKCAQKEEAEVTATIKTAAGLLAYTSTHMYTFKID